MDEEMLKLQDIQMNYRLATELYKKQVIALEEGPLEVADQINQAMRGLLDLLQRRDAKQLDDPEIRDLETMLKKKEKELKI